MNIIDIGAGNKISIALDQNGEVYIWGNCYNGISTNTIKEPTKEEKLSDIIAVDAKGENFYAIDRSGNAYVWGKGYEEPTKIESSIKYIDVSGKLLLGENGLVYDINKPEERINYLSNIGDVSKGETHDLFLELDGTIHSKGENEAGQLGNKQNEKSEKPVIVRTEDKYIENVIRISAGDKSSIVNTLDGKVYAFGENINTKLGIENQNINYAKEVTKLQDKEENELSIENIEKIETGNNHSIISDIRGFVYTVRTKHIRRTWYRR